MNKHFSTKSPIFWLVIVAGVILPALTLTDTARAIVTSAVVLAVVVVLVRERRQREPVRAER